MPTKAEFLEAARNADRIAEQQRKLRTGELVRVQNTDYCLPKAEFQELVKDLASQNLALKGPNDSPKGVKHHYPTDQYAIEVVEIKQKAKAEAPKSTAWFEENHKPQNIRPATAQVPARQRQVQLN